MQAGRLQVLLHTLVVMDLSWDRNGHRGAEHTADKFSRFAARMKEEVKELDTQECAVGSGFDDFIKTKL